ncbi:MmgE/PrpD family protein [Pseudomonas sp. v388]|uniref:MmgE/PrpD family protein n=1 Tax=Pseudomonas sp. v388 TaxID=2479849 RepID=UPI0013157EBF|nr:MmgE/PrpD family protein [Pseudomonas sp. v388]
MRETPSSLTLAWARHLLSLKPGGSAQVIDAARRGLTDYLACALGGAADPAIDKVVAAFAPAAGAATVIARGQALDALSAALINGYSGHALDYDDVQRSVRGHPSTVLLPALLALAQTRGISGHKLLSAYAVGVEAMGRLGLAVGGAHYEAGFHNTATLGTIATAAACGWLIGLSEQELAIAIGLAVTQSSGLRLQFGSSAKPLHAGLAARNGLSSALLAEAGLGGAAESLAWRGGFLEVYGFAQSSPEKLLERGGNWQILSPGLIFKRYASCAATHHAADAALMLRAEYRISPSTITHITVTFPPGLTTPLARELPPTRQAGRFSVEYVVAYALVHGHLDAPAFATGDVDAEVAGLMARVRVVTDEQAASITQPPFARFSVVEVFGSDGEHLSLRADAPRSGNPEEKLLAAAGSAVRGAAVLSAIANLDDAQSLQQLLNALAAPVTHH